MIGYKAWNFYPEGISACSEDHACNRLQFSGFLAEQAIQAMLIFIYKHSLRALEVSPS